MVGRKYRIEKRKVVYVLCIAVPRKIEKYLSGAEEKRPRKVSLKKKREDIKNPSFFFQH